MLVVVVVVVFGQKWFYSGKRSCIWLKVVLFAQSGRTWAIVVAFGQGGCILANWWFSVKVVLFGEKWFYSSKVVVF